MRAAVLPRVTTGNAATPRNEDGGGGELKKKKSHCEQSVDRHLSATAHPGSTVRTVGAHSSLEAMVSKNSLEPTP